MQNIIIYNRLSGKGLSQRKYDQVISILKRQYDNVSIYETSKTGDAYRYVKDASRGLKNLIILGGDGTINDCIRAIAESRCNPNILIVPVGTMNDVSRNLHLSRNPIKNLTTKYPADFVKHSILKVNNTYAVYGIAMGRYSSTSYNTSRKYKKIFGKLAYFISASKDLLHYPPIHMRITADGKTYNGKFALALVTTSDYIAGFRIDNKNFVSNKAKLVLIKELDNKPNGSLQSSLAIVKMFVSGLDKFANHKLATIIEFDKIHIDFDKNMDIVIDGEKFCDNKLDITVIPHRTTFHSRQ